MILGYFVLEGIVVIRSLMESGLVVRACARGLSASDVEHGRAQLEPNFATTIQCEIRSSSRPEGSRRQQVHQDRGEAQSPPRPARRPDAVANP